MKTAKNPSSTVHEQAAKASLSSASESLDRARMNVRSKTNMLADLISTWQALGMAQCHISGMSNVDLSVSYRNKAKKINEQARDLALRSLLHMESGRDQAESLRQELLRM